MNSVKINIDNVNYSERVRKKKENRLQIITNKFFVRISPCPVYYLFFVLILFLIINIFFILFPLARCVITVLCIFLCHLIISLRNKKKNHLKTRNFDKYRKFISAKNSAFVYGNHKMTNTLLIAN